MGLVKLTAFRQAVDTALDNDELSEEDERKLIRLQDTFNITQTDLNGLADRIAKAATLRDLAGGLIRSHIDVHNNPIALQKKQGFDAAGRWYF